MAKNAQKVKKEEKEIKIGKENESNGPLVGLSGCFLFFKKLSGVGETAITKYSIFPPEFAHQVKLLLSLPLQFKLKFKKATLL